MEDCELMYKMPLARKHTKELIEPWRPSFVFKHHRICTLQHLRRPLVMGEVDEVKDSRAVRETSSTNSPFNLSPQPTHTEEMPEKKTLWQKFTTPGSVLQIIAAALLAIAIGLIVTTQVSDIPDAAVALLAIPGQLWLRALRAVGQ